jgi:predicted RND superfamily exporter protein
LPTLSAKPHSIDLAPTLSKGSSNHRPTKDMLMFIDEELGFIKRDESVSIEYQNMKKGVWGLQPPNPLTIEKINNNNSNSLTLSICMIVLILCMF